MWRKEDFGAAATVGWSRDGSRGLAMRPWMIAALCAFSSQLQGQDASRSAPRVTAPEILRAVNRDSDCEFVVLWEHKDEVTGSVTVRVFGRGDACDAALRTANDRGHSVGIVFATIPIPADPSELELERKTSSPRQPRRSPEDFTLIHEVIE